VRPGVLELGDTGTGEVEDSGGMAGVEEASGPDAGPELILGGGADS
jgi:hypothetical protein